MAIDTHSSIALQIEPFGNVGDDHARALFMDSRCLAAGRVNAGGSGKVRTQRTQRTRLRIDCESTPAHACAQSREPAFARESRTYNIRRVILPERRSQIASSSYSWPWQLAPVTQ